MRCSCCGTDHGPLDGCALYESPFYASIVDYPTGFLTAGGVAMVYVVPCETFGEGELVRLFLKETEGLHGSVTSSTLPSMHEHRPLQESETPCSYVPRWHPELLEEAKKWRR